MNSPFVTYDPDVKALYLQFSEAEVTTTLELSAEVFIDVDADGQPVGIEVLNAAPSLGERLPAPPAGAPLRDLVSSGVA